MFEYAHGALVRQRFSEKELRLSARPLDTLQRTNTTLDERTHHEEILTFYIHSAHILQFLVCLVVSSTSAALEAVPRSNGFNENVMPQQVRKCRRGLSRLALHSQTGGRVGLPLEARDGKHHLGTEGSQAPERHEKPKSTQSLAQKKRVDLQLPEDWEAMMDNFRGKCGKDTVTSRRSKRSSMVTSSSQRRSHRRWASKRRRRRTRSKNRRNPKRRNRTTLLGGPAVASCPPCQKTSRTCASNTASCRTCGHWRQ